ncbi:NAD dependent epimerase/dehydratase family protein [Planococcus donghaensis MPA1U2]|uniref:dTDP-4-dehydrorhamnose reductase n=1 Tax=Planococcus donghaensis MPA1U2 TaxID=933115 RepID=E7RD96_9BACL|nr:sugar nucleotide-binding protein [Planococcus donghaensis]EGA91046.1 NAD dependent epimerase/dehydratase family protein [Planococcus donghaensis MPA1U2]
MRKLLILGASGLVGRALVEECKESFEIFGTYSTSPIDLPENNQFHLNVSELEQLKNIIRKVNPDAVVSCLRGDFNQQLRFHKELALELRETNGVCYYVSTANVFDGDYTKHHSEEDHPNAESLYGNFKISCEHELKQILNERAVIIRIPQIWGKQSPRLKGIESAIEEGQLEVYDNLACNHLSDTLLAKQLKYIIENKLEGIFHLGTVDMMIHQQFTEKLVKKLTDKKIKLIHKSIPNVFGICHFGLTSVRHEIPENLQITNQELIDYLIGSSE